MAWAFYFLLCLAGIMGIYWRDNLAREGVRVLNKAWRLSLGEDAVRPLRYALVAAYGILILLSAYAAIMDLIR